MSDKEILKAYDIVFQDCVRCYLENLEENEKNKINEDIIKEIAHKLIYKNEYLWEIVNDCIEIYLEDYIEQE